VEHFRKARLVRIARGGFAIWLHPFGMLDPQIVVNLLLELGVGMDLMKHAIGLAKDSSVARDVDQRWRGERAVRPSKGTPKGGTHVPALCALPSQLDYFVALALQQHGEQSALRKGRD
jgi:hypothetical protein